MTHSTKLSLAAALTLALAACGGATPSEGTSRIGPSGGTVAAGAARVTVPAGALRQEIELRIVEVEPRRGVARFALEPRGLALEAGATVSVAAPAGAGPMRLVEVENEVEHALENERETEHGREAEVRHLGEVELRHMNVCDPGCGAGFECDDGACKPHPEDATVTPPGNCPAGMELDVSDGVCKPHGGSGH